MSFGAGAAQGSAGNRLRAERRTQELQDTAIDRGFDQADHERDRGEDLADLTEKRQYEEGQIAKSNDLYRQLGVKTKGGQIQQLLPTGDKLGADFDPNAEAREVRGDQREERMGNQFAQQHALAVEKMKLELEKAKREGRLDRAKFWGDMLNKFMGRAIQAGGLAARNRQIDVQDANADARGAETNRHNKIQEWNAAGRLDLATGRASATDAHNAALEDKWARGNVGQDVDRLSRMYENADKAGRKRIGPMLQSATEAYLRQLEGGGQSGAGYGNEDQDREQVLESMRTMPIQAAFKALEQMRQAGGSLDELYQVEEALAQRQDYQQATAMGDPTEEEAEAAFDELGDDASEADVSAWILERRVNP